MYTRANRPAPPGADVWPSWRYSPDGEGRIFQGPGDVPFGWVRRVPLGVAEIEAPTLNRDELVAKLTDLSVTINPIWGLAQLKKELDDRSPSR